MADRPPLSKRRQQPAGPETHWGAVAQWYDQLVGETGSEYHQQVVLPGVLRLLGLEAGQRALDLACGQGVLCRLLQQRGVHVTGIDAASELIRIARDFPAKGDPAHQPPIRYLVADVLDLPKLRDIASEHFHAAACVLSIQNISALQPLCEGVARCLAPGGRFVIAMMHPCFRGPKATSWGWDTPAKVEGQVKKDDAEKVVQYRRVDRYLLPRKEPIVTHPGKDPNHYTWTFHRPLQAYVKALSSAGLMIDALDEWTSHKVSTSGPRAPAENQARKEIPLFMAIRAVRVPGIPGVRVPGVRVPGVPGAGVKKGR